MAKTIPIFHRPLVFLQLLFFLTINSACSSKPIQAIPSDTLSLIKGNHYKVSPIQLETEQDIPPVSKPFTIQEQSLSEEEIQHFLVTALYLLLEDKPWDAEKALTRIIESSPQNSQARKLLKQIREDVEDPDETQYLKEYEVILGDTWRSLSERVYHDPLMFYRLVRLNQRKALKPLLPGQTVFLPDYQNSDNVSILHEQALKHFHSGEYARAIEIWDRVLHLQPSHRFAVIYRGKSQQMLSDQPSE